MNRELPNERILYGARTWQHVIIQIDVGTASRRCDWLGWTTVTHRSGGKVQVQKRGAPREGWREHWRRYRAQHPELEKYWDESRATYPSWGPP